MKIDTYYQQRRCRPVTLVSGNARFMRIFAGVLWRGDVKRQLGCRKRQFSVISLAIPSVNLEMRPAIALLHSDTQSVVGFSAISKCMTLIDVEWLFLFHVELCSRAALSAFYHATFENNCVKNNEDRHILSAAEILDRDFGLWQ